MGISLCMIVKNEEDWVEGAVASVRSIVDDVIIVDTGSTDRTPDRIRAAGAPILKYEWKDSFAEARNFSLAQAKQEWILVLDADERIAAKDLPYILDVTRGQAADGYHLIQRNYVLDKQVFGWTANAGDYEEGRPYAGYVDNPLIRLFRNSPALRFHGAVHEIIDPTRLPQHVKFGAIPAVMHHYGKVRGQERVEAKQRFYLTLGLKKIKEEPVNAKAYFDLGIQYQELGRHAEACGCFDHAFEMTKRPLTLLYWAISEKHLRQYDSAATLLTRALRLGLDTPDVHLELGNVFLAQSNMNRAESEYATCLKMSPNNPIAAFNYGLVLRKIGDMKGAQKSYESALRLNPDFYEPAMELAVLYIQENRADEALKVLGRLSKVDGVALSLIGAAHLQNDNLEEAQAHLEAALKRDRSLVDARKNLAQVYTRKGDYARAARYMQSATTVRDTKEPGVGEPARSNEAAPAVYRNDLAGAAANASPIGRSHHLEGGPDAKEKVIR
jgi:tetratricopeptide (TPR) repeat protein